MAIQHTAVSYYGMSYAEHAKADFQEMIEHGCDTVILAITEFDMDFWFPNLNEIIKTAHEAGLRVIADTWGIGKYFGGEQVSLFLKLLFRQDSTRQLMEKMFAGNGTEKEGAE